MKIKFIGAVGGDSTGSCTLCEHNGTQFLVDFGTFQGEDSGRKNADFSSFKRKSIRFVLLTHAHYDHCGRIPKLIEGGFAGKIYCTKATMDLMILHMVSTKKLENLKDMMSYMLPHDKSGQKDARQLLKQAESLLRRRESSKKAQKKDLHEIEDALRDKLRERLGEMWQAWFVTDEDMPEIRQMGAVLPEGGALKVEMLRTSHLLGAVSFVVTWDCEGEDGRMCKKSVCFSGDLGDVIGVGGNYLPILREGDFLPEKIDYVVMESTRGGQDPDEESGSAERIGLLREWARSADTLVFACSAIQGAQNVLFDLANIALAYKEHAFEIVLDSKKTIKACEIYRSALMQPPSAPRAGEEDLQDDERLPYLSSECIDTFAPLLREIYIDENGHVIDFIPAAPVAEKFISQALRGEFDNRGSLRITFDEGGPGGISKCRPQFVGEEKKRKRVYITSSADFQHSIIEQHLYDGHGDERTAFVITELCKSPNGKTLRSWMGKKPEERKGFITISERGRKRPFTRIDGSDWKAKIYNIAPYYVQHADACGLLRFLLHPKHVEESQQIPEDEKKRVTVFLNHGNDKARSALKDEVERKSQKPQHQQVRLIKDVWLPYPDDWFNLDTGKWIARPNSPKAPAEKPARKKTGTSLGAMVQAKLDEQKRKGKATPDESE